MSISPFGVDPIPGGSPYYVDPTTGGVLIQVLLGGAAGVLFLLRLFWRRLMRILFRKRFTQPRGMPDTPADAARTSPGESKEA